MPGPERWHPPLAVRLSAGLHGTVAGTLALDPAWWPGLLAAIAANHLVLAAAGFWPRSQWPGPVVHRLPSGSGAVALTFDDGPDPAVTPHVLDQLAAAGAKATFFCIGQRAARQPALLRRILAEGHSIGNHTQSHPHHFACMAGRPLRRELMDAQETLSAVAGVEPRWFRAPMGIRSPLLDPALSRAGLRLASWTRRGYDTRPGHSDIVLARLTRGLAARDVLLLHDGNAGPSEAGPLVLAVLPRLLARLTAAGLSGVGLPEPTPSGGAG